jgi:pimeloyl-ACP methyl ester carboxylesterase
MIEGSNIDYSHLDLPEILIGLFHPRPEYGSIVKSANAIDVSIPVEGNIRVAGRFYMTGKSAPNNSMGINFVVVDYRGYGRSTGRPTVAAMMTDCRAIFQFTKEWLGENGYGGTFIVMGRSLGSASALELINRHKELINGLVLESSFANTGTLLEFLGVNASAIGLREEYGFRNLDKIRAWDKKTLIIHAEFDQFFPISEGQALYDACPSLNKTLLKIPDANHNDIFMRGFDAYMEAVKALTEVESVVSKRKVP